jgi:TonB family protein
LPQNDIKGAEMASNLREVGVDNLHKRERMALRRIWPAIFFFAIGVGALAASTTPANFHTENFERRERLATKRLIRSSQFVDVPHVSARAICQNVQAPQALTTPDPLFVATSHGRKVRVSFIIGADGRVHSPLILESAGLSGDRDVLQVVRSWRYRPATCDGVPTEIEGKVEFSSR